MIINRPNTDKVLTRSTSIIDHHTFKKVFDLINSNKWLIDETEALVELWNFCQLESSQNLISDLINRFSYLEEKDLKELSSKIVKHITEVWGIRSKGTKIVAISDEQDVDGSQAFLHYLKNKFAGIDGWTEKKFVNSIAVAAHNTRRNSTIILFDDFIGTGNTIIKKYNWLNSVLEKRGVKGAIKIKLLAIAGMESSKESLDELGVDYFAPLWLKKGISDHYSDEELSTAIQNMKELENNLYHQYRGNFMPPFGYKKSEALFSIMSFNVPNNVFPIFWWPLDKEKNHRKTLFKRIR